MKEMVKISGLSEHALRYYEKIGLIEPIERDRSSRHRLYGEDSVYRVITLACLRATGMSISQMRSYLAMKELGALAAEEQIELFTRHRRTLIHRMKRMQQQIDYLDGKISYWEALARGDQAQANAIGINNFELALELSQEDSE